MCSVSEERERMGHGVSERKYNIYIRPGEVQAAAVAVGCVFDGCHRYQFLVPTRKSPEGSSSSRLLSAPF